MQLNYLFKDYRSIQEETLYLILISGKTIIKLVYES